jgi:hypothetical protein
MRGYIKDIKSEDMNKYLQIGGGKINPIVRLIPPLNIEERREIA